MRGCVKYEFNTNKHDTLDTSRPLYAKAKLERFLTNGLIDTVRKVMCEDSSNF